MKRLMKLSVVLCLITVSNLSATSYYENSCNPCVNTNISLASPCETIKASVSALYLQPHASNLHYSAEAEPLPVPSPNWIINDIKPGYHFGFDVNLSAISHDRNGKLDLGWTHLNSTDSSSKIVATSDMVGPFFEIGPDATPYSKAHGKVKFNYDAVNLDYGILVNFGDYLHANFFGGVGGASIKEHVTSTYSNEDGTVSRTIKSPSSFIGAGPQFGLDFSYDVCGGFQVTGRSVGSLFVGNLKNHTTYDSYSPFLAPLGITPPNHQTTTVNNRTQIVPAFEGKLGIAYEFDLCSFAFGIEAGYEAMFYLNAIQSVDMGSEVITPPVAPDAVGVYARTFQRTVSNFAVAGPYLRLNAKF